MTTKTLSVVRAEPAEFGPVEADSTQQDVDDADGRVEQKVEEDSDDHERDHEGNEEDAAEQPGILWDRIPE